MNAGMENAIKLPTLSMIQLDAAKQQGHPLWDSRKAVETLEASIFTINNSDLFCVVDYHSKYFGVNGCKDCKQRTQQMLQNFLC